MTPFDEAVLYNCMLRVQAWERLNDPEHSGSLTMNEFYDLLIRAGYSPNNAQELANKRGWDRLQAGVKM